MKNLPRAIFAGLLFVLMAPQTLPATIETYVADSAHSSVNFSVRNVVVRVAGRVVDAERVAYGIRTIGFSPDSGFLLNGKRVPLQGVCLHHDLGPLGAAAFDRGIERQLEIMQQMGVNAIRTSHNPPAPALSISPTGWGSW